jgi:integrase
MIEDLQLQGYSDSTQTLYVSAVRQLCEHYDKSPGRITEEELRDYFLYGKNVKKWARSTSTIALCGIKFFFENTIKRPWPTLLFIRPGHEKKLPVVLSRDEVRAILSNLELLRYRACLTTIYACGLRVSEGINLRIEHIDSARGFIHVQGSKGKMGKKDRYVPLPKKTLQLLRQQWPPARRAYASERKATETKSGYSLLPATAAKTCPTPQGRSAKAALTALFARH